MKALERSSWWQLFFIVTVFFPQKFTSFLAYRSSYYLSYKCLGVKGWPTSPPNCSPTNLPTFPQFLTSLLLPENRRIRLTSPLNNSGPKKHTILITTSIKKRINWTTQVNKSAIKFMALPSSQKIFEKKLHTTHKVIINNCSVI